LLEVRGTSEGDGMTVAEKRLLTAAEEIGLMPVKAHILGGCYAHVPNRAIKELREAILQYYREKQKT